MSYVYNLPNVNDAVVCPSLCIWLSTLQYMKCVCYILKPQHSQKYSSPTKLPLAPSQLTFHRRIARGAFGSVYLATDQSGNKYAVKRTRK